jgi:hypothetical protein
MSIYKLKSKDEIYKYRIGVKNILWGVIIALE